MQKFDVIVVGAGPAGSQCARELSQKGKMVLLLEKSKAIGEPNFSSGGCPDYIFKEFNIPKSVIADYWDKFQIVTAKKDKTWHYDKPRGYVLHFNELKKFLVNDAAQAGCTVLVGTSATKPILKGDKVVGVQFTGIEKGEAYADIIVDASGPAGVIASKCGIRPAVLPKPCVGLEYMLTNVQFPEPHVLAFYLGKSWAKDGYGWVFPMGKHTAKVGLIIYDTIHNTDHQPLIEEVKAFIKKLPWLASAQPTEIHGGTIYVTGGIETHVKDNVITIGDAAAQINPLGGEGIRPAMFSARFASRAILNALDSGDMTKITEYERDWKSFVGKKWITSDILAETVYQSFEDKDFDAALAIGNAMTPETAYDIFFEYKYKKAIPLVLKNLHRVPKPLVSLAKQAKKFSGVV